MRLPGRAPVPLRGGVYAQPAAAHVVLCHARPKPLRTYTPTLPLGEAREALQRWADELERILDSAGNRKGSAVE